MISVLVTTAGGASGINCINALRNQKDLDLRIVASDASRYAAGLYLADEHYIVPSFQEKQKYIDALMNICRKESVDVILPTFSSELPILAESIDEFRSRKIQMCIASIETIKRFGNKWLSYLFFKDQGVNTPETWLLENVITIDAPIYIKPIVGSGSRSNHVIASTDELISIKASIQQQEYICQPYVQSKEFTVDVLADQSGKLLSLVPRERIKTKGGLAVVSRTIDEPGIIPVIEDLTAKGGLVGPFNVQYFKESDGRFLLFDVNTRFAAGGLPLSIRAGINIPLETVKLALGLDVGANWNYKRNVTMIRYYTELFLE